MPKIKTDDFLQTQQTAFDLAKEFKNGGVIALTGDLGAGKTTFAQGFAKGLGIDEKIISPTFLIIRQYPIPNQKNFLYHIDLYRLEEIDLKESGLKEILDDPENIVLIEWAEKITDHLPEKKTEVKLKRLEENIREIEIISS